MTQSIQLQREKFDGLADDYDRYRPRYPLTLLKTMVLPLKDKKHLSIVDIGAGTGIALEGIVELLGHEHRYHAIDVSIDMIKQGQRKFPIVQWYQGRAETLLPKIGEVDLVVAAQAFQWMDRPQLLRTVSEQLREGGVMAVIQNNRDFKQSKFLAAYETLLEEMSPHYSRYYRNFDFLQEMRDGFGGNPEKIVLHTHNWTMTIPSQAFIGMSRSSTQVQRAIACHGEEYLRKLVALIKQYEVQGRLELLYRSELYIYAR
ncbi:class I SAM-dependent methyltransferase [Bartonella machadoae]|uniref:class I SAM-dependent methyltransferase n=1 Tax=Bartonella machadoae TaxID=2893471 RepID=UPI001F4D0DF1|nr:class I SAM-dependent methyltransferase [Bartonella machadoae]UNE53558.1 class I SAM-dependent methyltransferase [Bartonella machadoae]